MDSETLQRARDNATAPPVTAPYITIGNQRFHDLVIATKSDGRTPKRVQRRRVAEFIDQAQQRGWDYYHPGDVDGQGGLIYDSRGELVGQRAIPGWYLYGYKWQNDDPTKVQSTLPPADAVESDED